MSDHFENINPLAEKLQECTIPEYAPSWKAMQVLLDSEMPVAVNKEWRRWLLLGILLLLLIGVCNCPGIMRTNKLAEKNELPVNSKPEYSKSEAKPGTNASVTKAGDSISMINGSKTASSDPIKINADRKDTVYKTEDDRKRTASKNPDSISLDKSKLLADNNNLRSKKIKEHKAKASPETNSSSFKPTKKINSAHINPIKKKYLSRDNKIVQPSTANKKQNNSNQRKIKEPEIQRQDSTPMKNDSSAIETDAAIISADSIKRKEKVDSLFEKPKAISKEKKDSVGKKSIKTDSIEEAKGLLLAVGLNQFFPVSNQQKSNFNSSGTSGGIGDYIPVPVIRYYFHKWFYLQAEAQFNTPQYTKTLLASQTNATDTSKLIFIKKLFYFNIPLSVHYSPLKNFYIGAGLQYSMLTNGVALFQDTKAGTQNPVVLPGNDTLLISAKVRSFKKDPVYRELKTYEFRFLFDINYQWRPLTLGLRYNQAFTNFINVRVSNAVITQAHNASLQLYLWYTIWDHRKKFLLPK